MRWWKYSILFLIVVIVSGCDSISAYFDGNKSSSNTTTSTFYIRSTDDVIEVAERLDDAGIIDDQAAFLSIAEYKGFTSEKLGAGKYEIEPGTEYKNLINGFTKNRLGNGNLEVEVNLTFNNCQDIKDIASVIAQQIELDSALFVDYVTNESVLNAYGFSKERIISIFIPNTYRMFWDTDHVEFTEYMAKAFKKFWTADRLAKLNKSGALKSQSDAVTLASIVYKEQSKFPEEWSDIAGLYINRLKKGMKLQSDPTFRYCWGDELDGVERLLIVHRERDCPYNTYIYAGLPPGPICIPPAATVDAVLNAENNDYFYMCAKPGGEGLHNFAKSYNQHLKNAREFQVWMNNRN
jgi:UPF0755 protein